VAENINNRIKGGVFIYINCMNLLRSNNLYIALYKEFTGILLPPQKAQKAISN
jgi:hypothetical protein